MFGMSETPIRIFIVYQSTDIFNGSYGNQYFVFERYWKKSQLITEEPTTRGNLVEPSIPDEVMPPPEPSSLQRFLRRLVGNLGQEHLDLQAPTRTTPNSQAPPTSANLNSGSDDYCYVKKVVLSLNGIVEVKTLKFSRLIFSSL